jgi:hypothetical protein
VVVAAGAFASAGGTLPFLVMVATGVGIPDGIWRGVLKILPLVGEKGSGRVLGVAVAAGRFVIVLSALASPDFKMVWVVVLVMVLDGDTTDDTP